MASSDPTGGERAVPLSFPAGEAEYLRQQLSGFKADLEDDLKTFPDSGLAERWRAETDAYGRLLAGLEAGEIVADADVRRLVHEWLEARNEVENYDLYERVVFEHRALRNLGDQIGAGR